MDKLYTISKRGIMTDRVKFYPVQELDTGIIRYARAASEYGEVSDDYDNRVSKGHRLLCIAVNNMANGVIELAEQNGLESDETMQQFTDRITPDIISTLPPLLRHNVQYRRFEKSEAGENNYLGGLGMHGDNTHYYLATPEMVEALHTHGIISDETAGQMRVALSQRLTSDLVDTLASQGLIDAEKYGEFSAVDQLKNSLATMPKFPPPNH